MEETGFLIESKKLYSTAFQEYILDDEMLRKMQSELFKILLDVKYVCEKYDIKYMLNGGTLLGAVRHKGFIPWDDDLDIMMKREEADKLAQRFREEFPDKYIVAEPLCDEKYVVKSVKIFKKGTKYVEIPYVGIDVFDMLFIDVFVIENVPANKLMRSLHSRYYNFIYKAASVCVDYKYPSPVIEEKAKENEDVKKYVKLRKRLGCFFSHVGGMKFYLRLCEKIANKKRHTGWLGIPSGGCVVENFPEKMYTELTTAEFCGEQFPVPKDYDGYLTVIFGDYMKLPEPSERDCHVAYKVEF